MLIEDKRDNKMTKLELRISEAKLNYLTPTSGIMMEI